LRLFALLCYLLSLSYWFCYSLWVSFLNDINCSLINQLWIFQAPCLLTKCHEKASGCINYPFRARCVCDYGYAGDGIKYLSLSDEINAGREIALYFRPNSNGEKVGREILKWIR
jgi:hypothetical protein